MAGRALIDTASRPTVWLASSFQQSWALRPGSCLIARSPSTLFVFGRGARLVLIVRVLGRGMSEAERHQHQPHIGVHSHGFGGLSPLAVGSPDALQFQLQHPQLNRLWVLVRFFTSGK
jgi:hypothetical protein